MGESTKAICGLMIIIGAVVSAFAWMLDRPDAAVWGTRIGGAVVAIFALSFLAVLQFRPDRERDYLKQLGCRNYFNRDGLCFFAQVAVIEGFAFFELYFQGQYDSLSVGRVAFRAPWEGIDAITFEINCPSAGFGVARVPIPIPKNRQGKCPAFEVGASVEYPEGKGERVRFRDGFFLRANTKFDDSFKTALVIALVATGSIMTAFSFSKPVDVKIHLPVGVEDELPVTMSPSVEILWQSGAPTLDESLFRD